VATKSRILRPVYQKSNIYVSLLSHCLVNIQNYQGIEIIGIKTPVYLTRFDVAHFGNGSLYNYHKKKTHRFFFGKIPPPSDYQHSTDYEKFIKTTDKTFSARWYCRAQFDLFFPEPLDAPHVVYHSQNYKEKSLFDIIPKKHLRESWSMPN